MSLNDGNRNLSVRRPGNPQEQDSGFSDFSRSNEVAKAPAESNISNDFDEEAYQYGFTKRATRKCGKKEAFSKKKDLYLIKAERFGEYLTEATYKNDLMEDFKDYFNISNLTEDEIKAVIKGVFLASGCIVDPKSDYRYEASFKNKSCAEYYIDVLSLLDFTPKLIKREKVGIYIVYFKESEQISYMLGLLEANRNMLAFENIRVEREVSNTKNRTNNCELANLAKSMNTAREQINAINKTRKSKFQALL